MGVSKFGKTNLMFVDPRVKINGTYCCDVPEMDISRVYPWVGLGWVKKIGPTYNSATFC